MKLKIKETTVQLWAFFVAAIAAIFALAAFKILPFEANLGFYHGIFTLLIGVTLAAELLIKGRNNISIDNFGDAVVLILVIISFILAFTWFGLVLLPETIMAGVGAYYIIALIAVIYALYQ